MAVYGEAATTNLMRGVFLGSDVIFRNEECSSVSNPFPIRFQSRSALLSMVYNTHRHTHTYHSSNDSHRCTDIVMKCMYVHM